MMDVWERDGGAERTPDDGADAERSRASDVAQEGEETPSDGPSVPESGRQGWLPSDRPSVAARGDLYLFVLITLMLVVSILWHPADDGVPVLCPFRFFTGIPCMGCGLTRSFCATAKGELARAFAFHPLGPIGFAAACAYWARGAAALAGLRVGSFDDFVRRRRLALAGIALLLATWAAKLVFLYTTGQLSELARHGALYSLFGGL